jgi:hypothetical protein
VSATAPSPTRPSSDAVTHAEVEALVEALIEEARQRARRRRRRNGAYVLLALALGIGIYGGIIRALHRGGSTADAASQTPLAHNGQPARNGPLTLFVPGSNGPGGAGASIVTIGEPRSTIWHCPGGGFCGQAVSFAWAPDGRRVAFSLDEIGGNSPYVGLHVVNVVSGKDTHIPAGAPTTMSAGAWGPYLQKMQARVGCWPATDLAWSPDGSSIAYRCEKLGTNSNGLQGRPHINVLRLRGSGYTTLRTDTVAYWPSWSPTGTRIAYATALIRPTTKTQIYTVALDGSHRRLLATGGTAPAWSPDGRTIAYQTRCGIRLITREGRDVTPRAAANRCGAIGLSGPPVWSPDGRKLAVETKAGIYVMEKSGSGLHLVSGQATTTWYGALPGRPSWQPGG